MRPTTYLQLHWQLQERCGEIGVVSPSSPCSWAINELCNYLYHSKIWSHLSNQWRFSLVTMKQIDRSLGGPEFPVDNHNSSVASEGSGQECRAGIAVRPTTQNALSFLTDRGSLSHKLLHQEETTQNCCSTNAHLGIVCQGITFTFDGSVASLPFPPI